MQNHSHYDGLLPCLMKVEQALAQWEEKIACSPLNMRHPRDRQLQQLREAIVDVLSNIQRNLTLGKRRAVDISNKMFAEGMTEEQKVEAMMAVFYGMRDIIHGDKPRMRPAEAAAPPPPS